MAKLALKGGNPVRTERFTSWPKYGKKEEEALVRVLNSNVWGTLGPEVKKFSERFAKYQDSAYGLCITNGTVTLEVILRALGIGQSDEVILPPYTFNATLSSILMNNATPVFADIEPGTYNIDPDSIEKVITSKTKAIIPVHIGGRACDMDRIMAIAKKHGLYVIEDSAHAHGSEFNSKKVGSIGDAGSFSFQASKNLTCGEGGFITTNNTKLYEQCWSVHHCGRDFHGTIWYDHKNIGTNARMAEWQAAILDAQMDKLDAEIDKRQENAAYLNSRLEQIPCVKPMDHDKRITRNSYHLFLFKYVPENMKNISRDAFIKAMTAEGIPCSTGYACLYKQGMLQSEAAKKITGGKIDYASLDLKVSEKAASTEGLWLTQNLLLSEKSDIDNIADAIAKIYENSEELI